MKQVRLIGLALVMLAAAAASADVVVERWGGYKYAQHADVTCNKSKTGIAMVVDLSGLPKGTTVYRSRLVFLGGSGYEVFSAVKGQEVALKLVPPYNQWFDATDAVRDAVKAGRGKVTFSIRRSWRFKETQTFLEIAYDGVLKDPPQQVTGVAVTYHPGQCLVTWKEIWDIAEGKENITWGEMVKKIKTCTPLGIVPRDDEREIRYRIYRHTKPITPANIGEAEMIHEVMPGSVYIDERVARGKVGEQGPTFLKKDQGLVRVTLAPGKTLPPGTGFRAHTVTQAGKAWYAVVTAVNGVENTSALSEANVVGPIEQKVTTPMPVLYAEKVTELRRPAGAKYHQQWYTWWLVKPLSPYPKRYDVVLDFCPQTMAKPAPLVITRGHAWTSTPEPPRRASPRKDIVLSPSSDSPNAFWMGLPDSYHSLRTRQQAEWRPWPQYRADVLIKWVKSKFKIDDNRIVGSIGCWGMMEIERPDLYAYLHGWGEPEVTKGFQCWGRAGVWGRPSDYTDKPKQWNPFHRQDYSRYILENPKKETPFFIMHTGWGAHFTEMGWPPFPRFWRAMMDTKRPVNYLWSAKHRPTIRKNQSVPAFGNCSLDGNPGNGDLRNGETFGANINGFLTWDSETIADAPDRWEMTVILDNGAPLAECTVDLTPRKCQKFKAKPGGKFKWTCTALVAAKKGEKPAPGKVLGSGTAAADKWGLVTIKQMRLLKGGHRVVIVKQ